MRLLHTFTLAISAVAALPTISEDNSNVQLEETGALERRDPGGGCHGGGCGGGGHGYYTNSGHSGHGYNTNSGHGYNTNSGHGGHGYNTNGGHGGKVPNYYYNGAHHTNAPVITHADKQKWQDNVHNKNIGNCGSGCHHSINSFNSKAHQIAHGPKYGYTNAHDVNNIHGNSYSGHGGHHRRDTVGISDASAALVDDAQPEVVPRSAGENGARHEESTVVERSVADDAAESPSTVEEKSSVVVEDTGKEVRIARDFQG
jgi:hypothetical protein